MRLSVKALTNYVNVNCFDYSNEWIIRAGDPNSLYFQLVDLDRNELRYMPGIGSSNQPVGIKVVFPSIDDTQVITLVAIQEENDPSIWRINLTQNDKPNSGRVQFIVSEGASIRRFSMLNLVTVEYALNDGGC